MYCETRRRSVRGVRVAELPGEVLGHLEPLGKYPQPEHHFISVGRPQRLTPAPEERNDVAAQRRLDDLGRVILKRVLDCFGGGTYGVQQGS